jgi:predicted transglutaminase-like cysteine proteinase
VAPMEREGPQKMKTYSQGIIRRAAFLAVAFAAVPSAVNGQDALFVSIGPAARPPIGWVEFCLDRPRECDSKPSTARSAYLSTKAWKELVRINKSVNEQVKPITDYEHWGVPEKWSYPDDGYGDCEDYALLKRRMLVDAGWPREALLMTVVREKNGNGHAVLTVKTDKGEFILDNQEEKVLLWSETSYRFVKRQSQIDQNRWVSLGDPRPTISTASSR